MKKIILIILVIVLIYIFNYKYVTIFYSDNLEHYVSKKNKKFLVYKGSGGLVHLLSGLVTCIEHCNEYNFSLILDVKNHKPFGIEFKKIFELKNIKFKYYEDYSIIDENYTFKKIKIEDIKKSQPKFIQSKYGYFLKNINISKLDNKNNLLVFSGCKPKNIKYICKYIKLNPKFEKKIKSSKILFDEKYVSIHYRNTDKKNNFDDFKKKIILANKKYKIYNFFIATDDYEALKKFKSINKKNTFKRITIPDKGIKNLHYSDIDKYKLLVNLMKDMFYILKSDYFIPSYNSGVSKLLICMIKSKNNFFNFDSKTKLIDKI